MFEFFYLKVLVNIVIANSKTVVYIEILNKKGIVNTDQAEFNTKYLSKVMYEYIQSFIKESPFFYISILDTSSDQGAIPSCAKGKISSFHDLSYSEYKCYDDKWSYYTSKSNIYDIQKAYEKIGVDFIFSPFVVLRNFFKDKIQKNMAVFILIEEKSLSLSVFKKSELLYAEYLDLSLEMDKNGLAIEDTELSDINLDENNNTLDLDDIESIDEVDELDSIDDFGDIEDLDSIEEIEEFNDIKNEEELTEANDISSIDTDKLNEDYQRYIMIQSSINNFYKNEKFDSEFIEHVYIADSMGISSDLKKYLEEEMFLSVYIRHLELCIEVCEVTKMELI